jgi:riboflavin kinase
MSRVLCLRGPVAKGYGRGGKKLGVPTANLPESLFNDALSSMPTGVYCGWATVDDDQGKSSPPVKAVVNVGYSPTFVGVRAKEPRSLPA